MRGKLVVIVVAVGVALATGDALAWQPSTMLNMAISQSESDVGGVQVTCPSSVAQGMEEAVASTFSNSSVICADISGGLYSGLQAAQMVSLGLSNLTLVQNWMQKSYGYIAAWYSTGTNEGLYAIIYTDSAYILYVAVQGPN